MSSVTPLPIVPPPGVVVTETERVVEGRWILPMDKIRFVKQRPQKVGGNVRVSAVAMSGTPRATHAWRDFLQNQYLAAGTYRKLYAFDSGYNLTDITPFRTGASGPVTIGNNPLSTTIGSNVVGVVHAGHGLSAGDQIYITGATAIGGITPNGTFVVNTVVDANDYTYLFTSNATSTVAAGGGNAVAVQYEIPIGTELGAFGQGWGVGPYGLGTYGTARAGSTIFTEPRIWSQDHFGKILLAAYNGGAIYTFDPTVPQPWPRAQIIPNAPTNVRFMFITPERFVFALCDAMVLNSSSQGDYTTWTPATNNTAFSRTLTEGTKLVGGRVLAPFVSLVWSDAALFIFQYTGSQFLYNSSLAGKDCGLISPNAAVTVDGIAYWQGQDNFYTFNGGTVGPVANVEDIRKYVFDALPDNLGFQCHAVFVPKYHEIWFFYPTMGDSNPTHYVIFHINDQCWSVGTFTRASGTHFTQGDTSPVMAGNDGFLYNHDPIGDTFNDNGNPLTWALTLSPYAMQEGLQSMDLEGILFDFFQQSGNVYSTINTYNRLTDAAPMDSQAATIPSTLAGLTDFRVSGRYVGLTLTSSDLGNYIRYGKPVAFVRPTARRR
jgi:hypothetical protein